MKVEGRNSRLTDRVVFPESQLVGQPRPRRRVKVARQRARDELDEDSPAVGLRVDVAIS